jgi:hypothetical protein
MLGDPVYRFTFTYWMVRYLSTGSMELPVAVELSYNNAEEQERLQGRTSL